MTNTAIAIPININNNDKSSFFLFLKPYFFLCKRPVGNKIKNKQIANIVYHTYQGIS